MSEQTFFVLTCDEDGIYVRGYTKEKLLAALAPEGDLAYIKRWDSKIPDIDKGCWYFIRPPDVDPDEIGVIIVGRIVEPSPAEIVTSWKIDE